MRIAELTGEVPPAARPPVLCYHRVGGPLELGVTRVARSSFARQMKTLARAGWRTLTLAEFSHRVAPTAHVAVRRPGSSRARAVSRDPATSPGTRGGSGCRLSLRGPGRAD